VGHGLNRVSPQCRMQYTPTSELRD
jgi:hypothetical protein